MTASNTPTEKRLLWLIRDLVIQSCTDIPKDSRLGYDDLTPVFSGFIGVHAEAIALLAEYGLVSDLSDNGGRAVSGKVLPLGESAKVLKTGPFKEESKFPLAHLGYTPETFAEAWEKALKEENVQDSAQCEPVSEEALVRGIDAFFRPSPLFERLRKAAE